MEHSRKASKSSPRHSFGNALEMIRRCKQIIPLPANLGLRVTHASKKGLTNDGRSFRSLPTSALHGQTNIYDGKADLKPAEHLIDLTMFSIRSKTFPPPRYCQLFVTDKKLELTFLRS